MSLTEDDEGEFAPTIQNILDQKTLKWIFVGGKGGVGKTTTSCSLGVLLSQVRESVLIVSTDPAHNLSDAFAQKFSHEPQLVNGFTNLYCMEVESSKMALEMQPTEAQQAALGLEDSGLGNIIKDIGGALPGIDETMSFLQIMKSVQQMEHSCIVFDTAPTGHTLRLLRFPTTLTATFEKLSSLKQRFGGIFSQVSSLMGMGGNNGANMQQELMNKFEEMKGTIESVNKFFRDPDITTFICVCIPEFLSLYETERLVQELTKYEIDTHNLVVNQVLFAEKDACRKFLARKRMQDKYIKNIYELYGLDFNISILPITDEEVRGTEKIKEFAQYYIHPYQVASNVEAHPQALDEKEKKIVEFVCDEYKLNCDEVIKKVSALKID